MQSNVELIFSLRKFRVFFSFFVDTMRFSERRWVFLRSLLSMFRTLRKVIRLGVMSPAFSHDL